jgi:hypothetical protein
MLAMEGCVVEQAPQSWQLRFCARQQKKPAGVPSSQSWGPRFAQFSSEPMTHWPQAATQSAGPEASPLLLQPCATANTDTAQARPNATPKRRATT